MNVDEYAGEMQRRYPQLIGRHGPIQGRVVLGLRIAADGTIAERLVIQGSGEFALDELAMELSEVASWTPPTAPEGCRLEVWISHPMSFGMRG